MVLWNILNGGLSHNGPLLRPFESMQGSTLGTNNHHVMSVCVCVVVFLLRDLSPHLCS
jgi:hypothetical protein